MCANSSRSPFGSPLMLIALGGVVLVPGLAVGQTSFDWEDATICAIGRTGSCEAEGIRRGGQDGRRLGRADFTVEIPAGVELRIGSGQGDLRIAGATAGVRAGTGNGGLESDFPIRLTGRVGPRRVSDRIGEGGWRLTASTGNGSIELRGHGGSGRGGRGR
jgi:hypothetical protein